MIGRTVALITFLVAVATAFCPDIFKNQTACSCYDYIDGAVIKCSGPQGPSVIEQLKKSHVEIRELTLENANIVEIGPRAFKNLRIKKLMLDKNRIKRMHSEAFRGLESVLQELSLNMNRLTEVPTAAVSGLRALNVISMKCNNIGNLTDAVFINNNALIDVNLAGNKICEIGEKVFQNVRGSLQNLILDNNCMTNFPAKAVENMENLIALHLKYNQINEITKNQLINMTALSMLTLTGNNISTVSKDALQNTPNLRYLYLAENAIRGFEAGTMAQFKQVQVVDMSFNEISEISTETFGGLESLQHINLESNQIKEVAPGAFAGTPLLLLWLPNNCITSVTANMFQGAPFLRQVSLSNNNIKEIQALSFAHLANLHTLDLAFNKIMSLQNGAITGSDHLTVRLQENPMVCGQDGFHVMTGNEAINLTTEANLICKGNWHEGTADLCPKAAPRPVAPQTCPKTIITTTTTVAPKTPSQVEEAEDKEVKEEDSEKNETKEENMEKEETKEKTKKIEKSKESENTKEVQMSEKGEKTKEDEAEEETEEATDESEEEEEEDEETTAVTKTTQKTTTTTEQPSTIPGPQRKVNMDRFWRLAKRPNANSPFMKHQARLGVANAVTPKILKNKEHPSVEETTDAEEEEEEEESEEYEEEEESATTSTTIRPTRRIPSRVAQRQKMMSSLPPWIATNKGKTVAQQADIDFNKDAETVETVQVDNRAATTTN